MRPNHPLCRPVACLLSAIGSLLIPCCAPALAQNLAAEPPRPAKVKPIPAAPAPDAPAPNSTEQQGAQANTAAEVSSAVAPAAAGEAPDQLSSLSLFAVRVPPPKKLAKHEMVMVIINESSAETFTQTTDYKKDYNLQAQLTKFPSLSALFSHGTLTDGIGSIQPGVGATGNKELKGNGQKDRKDQVTAKISAFIMDVKPNGNLVLEARESRSSDKEVTTVVLSGTCRAEDITKNNTIQSSQLAGLTIRFEHEGNVKETGEKGFIARVLEGIFNF